MPAMGVGGARGAADHDIAHPMALKGGKNGLATVVYRVAVCHVFADVVPAVWR